ncbi:MAG: hypothetical protein ACLFR1_14170 [Spirochaetia bacterium]
MEAVRTFLENAPIAKPRTDMILHFEQCINQLYLQDIQELQDIFIPEVLGSHKESITEREW